jgi:circadian clock protein KaiC
MHGVETHLVELHKLIRDFNPHVVVIDPIGSLIDAGTLRDATIMMTRLIDFLKQQRITAFLTNLTSGADALEKTSVEISSLVDTWLLLRDLETRGERNRAIYILKSRGMAHSNQLREFLVTDHGIELLEVYLGPEGVLTGSARLSQKALETAALLVRQRDLAAKQRDRTRKREAFEADVDARRRAFEAEEAEVDQSIQELQAIDNTTAGDRETMARSRRVESTSSYGKPRRKRR